MAQTKPHKKLTLKQQRFIRSYADCGNGTRAILAAGYECKTKRSAKQMSYQLLKKPHVASGLRELLDTLYPNLKKDAGAWLIQAIQAPIAGSPADTGEVPAMTWAEKRGWLEMLARLSAPASAPTQTTVNVVAGPPQLPRS